MTARLATPLPSSAVLTELMARVRTTSDDVNRHRSLSRTGSSQLMRVTGREPAESPINTDPHDAPWTTTTTALLRNRRSLRFFDDAPIELATLTSAVGAAVESDLAMWGDTTEPGAGVVPVVIALRVHGLRPGIYRFDHTAARYTRLATVDDATVADMVLQTEYAGAAAIVAAIGSLDAATEIYADHGQRLLNLRGGGLCYCTYLQACARGLTGSVFAGFLLSGLSRLLVIDGFHQTQVFAVALGHQAQPTDSPTRASEGKNTP